MVERKERQPCQAQGRDEQPWIAHLRKNSGHIQGSQSQSQDDHSPQGIDAGCHQVHKESDTDESHEHYRQQFETPTKRQASPIALTLWRRDKHVIGQQVFEEKPAQKSKIHNEHSIPLLFRRSIAWEESGDIIAIHRGECSCAAICKLWLHYPRT